MKKTVVIKICGAAGTGIMQLGDVLAGAFNRAGLYALVYPEYESRIRGGDNNIQIVISNEPYLSARTKTDVLFSMSPKLLEKHLKELNKDGLSFECSELGIDQIEEVKQNPIVANAAVAGFLWKLFFDSEDLLLEQIKVSLDGKISKANIRCAKRGFELNDQAKIFSLKPSNKKIFCASGNEIFAKASLKACVEYVSIYPMTPITSLLETLSEAKITLVQPEDEVFAALSTLGASYAGKRALTATSGGGFCLMCEAVGFSAMAEIPMVIILGQRTGPSSGIPTYNSQADLNLAIFSGNGDAPKIVLAPGDLSEINLLTQQAFNLADRYQVPVILLTDKYLSETRFSEDKVLFEKTKVKIDRGKKYLKNNKNYFRYAIESDGISSRALPGEASFVTNSYEHDEYGFSTDDAEARKAMNAKRMRKLSNLKGGFEIYGDKSSKKLVIGWGSTKTILREYFAKDSSVKYIHINRLWPFPSGLERELLDAEKVLIVENNSTGQLAGLIRRETGIRSHSVLKDDGRPFFYDEIVKILGEKL